MSDVKMSDVPEGSFHTPRTIVLCFDGTNGQYNNHNTNVVKFFGLLRKDCPEQQVAYYQAGIGTYFSPGVVSPLWTWLASLLDEAVAWYLDAHVMAGYRYLMDNYHSGDKICLFGFSRGAYTARALAGMLYKVGLLPQGNSQQINFAYKLYKRTDEEGVGLASGFKQTFSQDVQVEFIGVWDTVQSTGALINRELPFSDSNTSIRVFRHALSLDEHRSRFRPNLYHWAPQDMQGELTNLESTGILHTIGSTFNRLFKRSNPPIQLNQTMDQGSLLDGTQRNEHDEVASETQPPAKFTPEEQAPCTDVLEVWFSGCHSDIGGGNVQDSVAVSLAQVTLHWMVEEVIESQCGILFDSDQLARIGFTDPPFSTTQNARDTSDYITQRERNEPSQSTLTPEIYSERLDAVAPLFDALKQNILWWILEVLPYTDAWQDSNGKWHTRLMIGLGRGRYIPFEKPKFHHTVKERMNYGPLKYKPRAVYDNHEVYV